MFFHLLLMARTLHNRGGGALGVPRTPPGQVGNEAAQRSCAAPSHAPTFLWLPGRLLRRRRVRPPSSWLAPSLRMRHLPSWAGPLAGSVAAFFGFPRSIAFVICEAFCPRMTRNVHKIAKKHNKRPKREKTALKSIQDQILARGRSLAAKRVEREMTKWESFKLKLKLRASRLRAKAKGMVFAIAPSRASDDEAEAPPAAHIVYLNAGVAESHLDQLGVGPSPEEERRSEALKAALEARAKKDKKMGVTQSVPWAGANSAKSNALRAGLGLPAIEIPKRAAGSQIRTVPGGFSADILQKAAGVPPQAQEPSLEDVSASGADDAAGDSNPLEDAKPATGPVWSPVPKRIGGA